jgi:hypothetical protein
MNIKTGAYIDIGERAFPRVGEHYHGIAIGTKWHQSDVDVYFPASIPFERIEAVASAINAAMEAAAPREKEAADV